MGRPGTSAAAHIPKGHVTPRHASLVGAILALASVGRTARAAAPTVSTIPGTRVPGLSQIRRRTTPTASSVGQGTRSTSATSSIAVFANRLEEVVCHRRRAQIGITRSRGTVLALTRPPPADASGTQYRGASMSGIRHARPSRYMASLKRQSDRRVHPPDRLVRGGRRLEDAVLHATCRSCGSRELDAEPAQSGTVSMGCRACGDAWVMLPKVGSCAESR